MPKKMVSKIKHRCEEEIVADILAVVDKGNKKTRIMYAANLSYALTDKYLTKLLDCGLVTHDSQSALFSLTKMGRRYLEDYQQYKDCERILNSNADIFESKRSQLTSMLLTRSVECD
ncbi:winged helix-turn-helix domain-containing protein [Candidatus Bathyarchaeota archaeon]|nr:winged helix-turn-helix domain-containing protein [Candidatus Bathyarchaeota archaeon]